MLSSLKSFGVYYMSPYAPTTNINHDGYFLEPVWKREKRADFLNTKRSSSQNHISMKWKEGKNI